MEKINLQWLRQARRKRKLNLAKVAHLLGRSKSTVWRWENGVSAISMSNLCALAALYQVPVSSFFEMEE